MDGSPLHHALEAGRRFRIAGAVGGKPREVLVEELRQVTSETINLDSTGAQNRDGVTIIDQAQQQMFERGVFVLAFGRQAERTVERLF